MEDYEFVLEGQEVKVHFDGENHQIGKAYINGENIIFIHPTYDEMTKGKGVLRYELTEDDIQKIQELTDAS